ncbi:hypothetical protein L1987_14066 [Smallanthus sonchifolius]|uniref:Uncharacterized protein n=1 Tax=Smallanthus sonchifolius TaxID=185202 RepID=A0ACB9J3X9_9ASTR|nr:hypothetical protein L1987_14066 [Smallanthus sonchifolius]
MRKENGIIYPKRGSQNWKPNRQKEYLLPRARMQSKHVKGIQIMMSMTGEDTKRTKARKATYRPQIGENRKSARGINIRLGRVEAWVKHHVYKQRDSTEQKRKNEGYGVRNHRYQALKSGRDLLFVYIVFICRVGGSSSKWKLLGKRWDGVGEKRDGVGISKWALTPWL